MKNSKIMVDVSGKDNVVIVSQAKILDDEIQVVQKKYEGFSSDVPLQAAIIGVVGKELLELADKGVKDRLSLLLPEQVVIRAAEALKAKNAGMSVSDVAMKLYGKSWINKLVGAEKKIWIQALSALAAGIVGYQGALVLVNQRKLYRWEVKNSSPTGEGLADLNGKTATFVSGVCEELGLVCDENNRFNKTVSISVTSIRDRQGGVTHKAYVPRLLFVENSAGEQSWVSMSEAIDPDQDYSAAGESYAVTMNAARIHAASVAALPKRKDIKKVTITGVSVATVNDSTAAVG